MKPFLILQGRPEDAAADEEYASILSRGGIAPDRAIRVRLEREGAPEGVALDDVAGIVLGGGPACVSDAREVQTEAERRIETALFAMLPEICARDLPFLGCCYGIGALAHFLGGEVGKARYSEGVGIADCEVTKAGRDDSLLAGVPDRFGALVAHKEAVQELPRDCAHLVRSEACPFQMIRFGRNVYATQFHPEADADSFALRLQVYDGRGYFAAGEAEGLIAKCREASVAQSHLILSNFVARYG